MIDRHLRGRKLLGLMLVLEPLEREKVSNGLQ